MKYHNIREEELKNKVSQDYFADFDTTKIIGNIDFCISNNINPRSVSDASKGVQIQNSLFETSSLLWAEAKKGKSNIYNSLVQLILTIGKARTFDKYLPPAFLGAFDAEQIAFVAYNQIQEIFYLNDFNWNVTPSNHETKEFKLIFEKVKNILENNSLLFKFVDDENEIREFIKTNFVIGNSESSKIQIDKNNFIIIYTKWLAMVKPTIILDWDRAKKSNIIDGDFYLADLLSSENQSLKEKLFVILKQDRYELDRKLDEMGFLGSKTTGFNDNQKAHKQFWNKYIRPPKEEYWDYIVERRDLLVPQDVRERKGSFFTPQIWVELSQKYLTDELGENWQDEYYIWDCAAGTGNLLTGLTNKYNVYASTLDQQDVDVMKDRIKNGANLLESHVFQFDFLNDDFNDKKVPKGLQEIINNPEKRKKLLIYINPPYAENGSGGGKGAGKAEVSSENLIYKKYTHNLGRASRELFAQFFIRVYKEIPDCKLASFSTLKYINSQNFFKFRNFFLAKYLCGFIVPADSFDNVKGKFPIGFMLWDTKIKEKFEKIECDVYDLKPPNPLDSRNLKELLLEVHAKKEQSKMRGNNLNSEKEKLENSKLPLSRGLGGFKKTFYSNETSKYINDWIITFKSEGEKLGNLFYNSNDFQHQNFTYVSLKKDAKSISKLEITKDNLLISMIYFTVRLVEKATWLNDRDQFLYPNDGCQKDTEFQNNCLIYALFHGQNRISSKEATNHWIPFTEQEVNARDKFESNFMSKFIAGKIKQDQENKLFEKKKVSSTNEPLEFSDCAKAVFDAGRELYIYYHAQPNCNVNASLYDIKEHFQGRNEKGKMNNKSQDEKYTELIGNLRDNLNVLAEKIQPKVYEYGFLLE